MSDEKQLAVIDTEKHVSAFGGSVNNFENSQRMAKALAESSIVPKDYQGKVANCLVALEISGRTGSSVLAVMQSLNVIHGKPSWSGQYIIAAINASGRYSPLRFKMTVDGNVTIGGKAVKNQTCVAHCTDKQSGEILEGPPCSIQMAVAEGWYGKPGSKWPNMPELMLQYRAATFFGRSYVPELLLGMQSEDEVRDVGGNDESKAAVQSVNEKIKARKAAKTATPDIVVDAKPADERPTVEAENAAGEKEKFF